jgi:hypothetical protein
MELAGIDNVLRRGSYCTHVKDVDCKPLTRKGLRRLESNDPLMAGVLLAEDTWSERVGRAISGSISLRKLVVEAYEDEEGKIWLGEMFQALAHNRSIECLDLKMYECDPDLDIFHVLSPFLEHNHNLHHICVFESRVPKTFNSLVATLSKWKNSRLEHIQVCTVDATAEQSAAFFNSLSEHRMLLVVIFNCIIIDRMGCAALAALLDNPATKIHTLHLTHNNDDEEGIDGIDDECTEILSNACIKNQTLRSLSLTGNSLSATGWSMFSTFISYPTCALETLLLDGCQIGDEGVVTLADALTVNKSVKFLDLSYNASVTMVGWQELSQCLRGSSSTLEELYLDGCDINDGKALVFIATLAGNSSLKKLHVRRAILTDTFWKGLSHLLCDKVCIESTYSSNHTLCTLFTGTSLPRGVSSLLKINENENKSEVAHRKILGKHFVGGENGSALNHVFAGLPDIVLPFVIEYIGRNNHYGLTPMYNAIRGYPAVFDHCSSCMMHRGIKRKVTV